MASVLYVTRRDEWEIQIGDFLWHEFPGTDCRVCHTMDRLALELRARFYEIRIIMVVLKGKDELVRLYGMKELLEDRYVLMALPDQEKETIALAHKLRPRFVTLYDGDRDEAKTVLRRMIERYDSLDFNNKDPVAAACN